MILAEPQQWLQDPPGSGDPGNGNRSPRWRGNPPGEGVGSDLHDGVFDEEDLAEAVRCELVKEPDHDEMAAKDQAKDNLYSDLDYYKT